MTFEDRLIFWTDRLNHLHRELTPEQFSRVLECFWSSQLGSKRWMVKKIQKHVSTRLLLDFDVMVYGGWYGTAATLLTDIGFPRAFSLDIDPECEIIGQKLCHSTNTRFITADMGDLSNLMPNSFTVAHRTVHVNTSTEHVSQETYDRWFSTLRPEDTFYPPMVIMGNDLEIPEHVRPFKSLGDFLERNHAKNPRYAGVLKVNTGTPYQFNRYMAIL